MSKSQPKKGKVLPLHQTVRPQVMEAFQQSVARNRDLLKSLAR